MFIVKSVSGENMDSRPSRSRPHPSKTRKRSSKSRAQKRRYAKEKAFERNVELFCNKDMTIMPSLRIDEATTSSATTTRNIMMTCESTADESIEAVHSDTSSGELEVLKSSKTYTVLSRTSTLVPDVSVGTCQSMTTTPPIITQSSSTQSHSPLLIEDMDYGFINKDEYDSIMEHSLEVEREQFPKILEGNRIVDLNYVLSWALPLQTRHSKHCTAGTLFPVREDNRGTGLVSSITLACDTCAEQFKFFTESPDLKESKINTGAVWGSLATGSTYGHLLELLSVLDIPPITYHIFSKIEKKLTHVWDTELMEEMLAAGEEEKQIATEKGQIDDEGVPWITVYLDGGWSKRSYGHSYNAASGVGVIIGKETGKVLFVGVRNKYCSICTRAANQQRDVKQHICFKNWSGSSPAMEADIMVEGFSNSEDIHGVKYLKFIADGDSSVYARLKEKVSYGRKIEKIECKNHLLKNVTKGLYHLKNDSSVAKEGRKLLTQQKIKDIEKTLQRTLYENALSRDVQCLREDFKNTLLHVFGEHNMCKEYYCNKIGENHDSQVDILKSCAMFNHIEGAMDILHKKINRIIDNETNNRAEVFMAIVARFNSGKRLNLIQRGSYQSRATLSSLRYNKGVEWQYKPWKTYITQSPGKNFKAYLHKQARSAKQRNAKRKLFHSSEGHTKRQSTNKTVNIDYGLNAEEATLEPIEMETECKRLLQKMQISTDEQSKISRSTVGQFGNPLYEAERRDRLTASNFGSVIKRKLWTPCHNLVKQILFPKLNESAPVMFGKRRETVAIDLFSKQYNLEVEPAGLYVDVNYGFLGASPDGLVGTTHVVEVKCLYSVHKSGKTLEEAASTDPSLCLQKINGKLQLKHHHNYFYQIQGQLNICNRDACYFVVYCNDDMPLHVEEIKIDKHFWLNEMLPKLSIFYKECILPEMIRGNIRRKKKCQDPPYILNAIEERENDMLNKELKKIEKSFTK